MLNLNLPKPPSWVPWADEDTSFYFSSDAFLHDSQIVHWRNHLKFPEDPKLSPEAKDLIYRLLCDVEHRLGTGGVSQIKVRVLDHSEINRFSSNLLFFPVLIAIALYQAHPWFKDVVWDKLYEMDAAFKPEVNGELDTQNFMKFDEVHHWNLSFVVVVVSNVTLSSSFVTTIIINIVFRFKLAL